MSEREITIVPPTKKRNTQVKKNRLMRVASYSRVSTNFEDQLVSFYAQKSYYTDLILRTPGWKLAGTYADEGISGVTAENLERMKAMNEEAVALQKTLDEHKRRGGRDATAHLRMEEVERFLKEGAACAGQYEDALVRQVIYTIKVVDERAILVCFKNGEEWWQGMALRVRGHKRNMA